MQDIQEEEVKNKFIRVINQMIYEWRFEELINTINNKYPSFFSSNQNIFYIIMKFNFIKIILFQQDIRAAQDFYSQYLTSIMKKIYGDKSLLYNKKNFKYQYFLNQINNNNDKYLFFRQHFKSQIHLNKFFTILEKAFLKEQDQERNPVIFNVTKISNNPNKINDNLGKPLFKTERVNNLTYNNENMSEIEDELFKLNLGEAKKNIFNVFSTVNKDTNNKDNIYLNSANPSDIDTCSNNNNDEYNNCISSDISNIYNENRQRETNRNQIDSKKFLEKNEFTSFYNKETCNFNNKIRRVNLCKKIVRKFKKYLKSNKKEMNSPFWNSFCKKNYLPPFKLEDIEFKSFSRIYLNWLFSHEGGVDLYNDFIRNKGDEELNNIYTSYGVNDPEEKKYLKNYFEKFAIYFSNLKINENEIVNESNNTFNNNNEINKDFQADFANNNFFDNYAPSKEDNLSIGSINEFYHEERSINRGLEAKHFGVFNRMKISENDSNSSMEKENDNFDCNTNLHKNNNINKEYEYYNNYNIKKSENYCVDGFSINLNNNQKYESNTYPDIHHFYEYNINNINASFPHNFFLENNNINENINEYNKIHDNLFE